jgi:hypothetical protein
MSRFNRIAAQCAAPNPNTALAVTNSSPSVTNCAANRKGDAPSPLRTAISRLRKCRIFGLGNQLSKSARVPHVSARRARPVPRQWRPCRWFLRSSCNHPFLRGASRVTIDHSGPQELQVKSSKIYRWECLGGGSRESGRGLFK